MDVLLLKNVADRQTINAVVVDVDVISLSRIVVALANLLRARKRGSFMNQFV